MNTADVDYRSVNDRIRQDECIYNMDYDTPLINQYKTNQTIKRKNKRRLHGMSIILIQF